MGHKDRPGDPPPSRARATRVLGVTGLPAAGKSTVTALFGEFGAETADADALAHAALAAPAMARRVARLLGRGVLAPGGAVDRAAVAARVFGKGGREALEGLEGLLHPAVRRALGAAVAGSRKRGAPAVVLDVPLLFEGGLDGMCDATVFVEAPRGVRLRRARRRGWTGADLAAREARQGPAAERRRRSDFVIRNGGSRAAVRRSVRRVWEACVGEASRRA